MHGRHPDGSSVSPKRSRPDPAMLHTVLVILAMAGGIAGPALAGGPAPGRLGLSAGGEMQISAGDRCPVCAMLPIRYPRFAAAIVFVDGRTYYFCSPGCMVNAWLHPNVFLLSSTARLERPVVREYLSGETLDARDIFWVSGSDVVGPMGPALVPLKDRAHLDAFCKRHGAQVVFRLDELTHDNWQTLTGKRPASP